MLLSPLKPKPPWNVLVFPAASEIGLEIHRALSRLKEVVLFGANREGANLAQYHFARLDSLPSIHEADFLPRLKKLFARHRIDAIFPAHDDVLLYLAEHAVELDVTLLAPDVDVVRLCRSKRHTYETLAAIVDVPKIWYPDDMDITYPIFAKPDIGQGSQRARMLHNREEMRVALAREPDLILTEYLPGREYTVDCFSQNGKVLFARARQRQEVRGGIATLCQSVDLPEAVPWAERLQNKLGLRGAWFFQVKEDSNGKLRLLEVAPRIAGTMALHRVAGPNFPLLSLYEAAGLAVSIDPPIGGITLGRSLATHFVHDKPIGTLYIDLDDTLIVRGQVQTGLIALIYQCRNRSIPVVCVTRHKGDLDETLRRYRLDNLFDRIVHMRDDTQPKADYLIGDNAVFVDDSFAERHRASALKNVRVFDPNAALSLLDHRD